MIRFSDLNPIRFYQDRDWDYNKAFPTEGNLPSSISGKNIGTVIYDQPWATDNEIQIQVFQEKDDNVTFNFVINGVATPVTPIDVTPTGWNGFGNYAKIYKYTPTATGTLYFEVSEEVTTEKFEYYKSDCIEVKESLPECQRIVYYHRDNSYNTVFTKESTRVFFPVIFLEATYNEPLSGGENVISPSFAGSIRNLRDSPTEGNVLDISPVPSALVKKVRMISACSSISVNGISVQKSEPPILEHISGSNANVVKVNLWHTSLDYLGDYLPIYDIVPPDCGVSDDIQWWFKKVGNTYVDQYTGYTVPEVNGRIDFVPDLEFLTNPTFAAKVEIFNRNNVTIQASNDKSGYLSTKPYSFTTDEVSELLMHDWYNEFYKGKVHISKGRTEIIIYKTDKTLDCDKAIKEYLGYTEFWIDSGAILLEYDKYNIIKA
jgi:hypothetical protein